jgi:uncharacterized protein
VRFICPTCGRSCEGKAEGTRVELPAAPFCSERCRTVDLGSWLSESYRISSAAAEEDLDAGLPTEGGPPPPTHEN